MRPIKFRAWDKEYELMTDWFWLSSEGDLYETPVTVYDTPHRDIERNDDLIVMQSTGWKDKNGVEIYEGDIVDITQYFGGHPYGEIKYIIKRSKYNNNLVADSESGDWRRPEVSMSFRGSDDYEVIGNIYENPELLEELEE